MMTHLKSIQALRGVAALAVFAYHLVSIEQSISGRPDRITSLADPGVYGVDLFFVISGFVIVWVAAETPRGWRGARSFLFARTSRIYPLWWIFAGLAAIGYLMLYGMPWDLDRVAQMGIPGSLHLFQSMILWPQAGHPVLSPGWTLVHEIYFYIGFSLLILWVPARWRLRALFGWGAGISVNAIVGGTVDVSSQVLTLVFFPHTLQFLFGAVVAYAIRAGWRRGNWLSLGLASVLMIIAIEPFGNEFWRVFSALGATPDIPLEMQPWPRTLLLGFGFALLIYGLVSLEIEQKIDRVIPQWLIETGNWSYSLYLCHMLTISVAGRSVYVLFAPEKPGSISVFLIVATALTIATAYLSYTVLERPMIAFFKRRRPL